ncbi:MAG: Hpt domain-containing protein [Bacillota bacterium]
MAYNIKEAAQSLLVEEEELLEILDVFILETSKSLEHCEAALKSKDYEALKKIFHTLKGTSSNFRAVTLSDIAAAMEKTITSEEDGSHLPDLLAKFRKEFEAMQQLLAQCTPPKAI